MVYFVMKSLGFSLELCHVFPRVATEGFILCGLKFMGFFSVAEMVHHLLAVWAGEGCPEALSTVAVNHSWYPIKQTSAKRAGNLPCRDHW